MKKNEKTRLDAFEMKGLRKIMRLLWAATKTNEWVLNKVGVKRGLLDTVKEASILWLHHEETRKLSEKEIRRGTMPGARR